jgi:glycosyltransferase involved in cell wall biosynthesis
MRAWLLTIGEPLPLAGESDDRQWRTGLLARHLDARGHDVVWWSSTFDHFRKRQLRDRDIGIQLSERLRLELLRAVSYSKNVSLRRILHHAELARRFARAARSPGIPRPDIIVSSLPTLELCREAVQLGKDWSVPVVIDVRDMWPDAIADLAPRWARPLAEVLLARMSQQARSVCETATTIVGPSEQLMQWGLRRGHRSASSRDRVFPFGYSPHPPPADARSRAGAYWQSLGVPRDPSTTVACFFGSIGPQFDFELVLKAADMLRATGPKFQFVLCGHGTHLERIRRLAGGRDDVLLPGWVGAAEIWSLMRVAHVGLAPYKSTPNFRASVPNKPIEYMSAGLPVVSGLSGALADLLASTGSGLTYEGGRARDLYEALLSLHDDPVLRARLSAAASRTFAARFSSDMVYDEMARYLEEIHESHPTASPL